MLGINNHSELDQHPTAFIINIPMEIVDLS